MTEIKSDNVVLVSFKHRSTGAGGAIPNMNPMIIAAGGHQRAIRAQGDGSNIRFLSHAETFASARKLVNVQHGRPMPERGDNASARGKGEGLLRFSHWPGTNQFAVRAGIKPDDAVHSWHCDLIALGKHLTIQSGERTQNWFATRKVPNIALIAIITGGQLLLVRTEAANPAQRGPCGRQS